VDWRAWAGKSDRSDAQGLPARLDALAQKAAAVLAWERVWPALVGILVVVALFLGVSWAGVWIASPRWLRMVGVAVFALLLIGAVVNLARLRWPGRRESIARLDRDSGLAHRPATAVEDRLANDSADPATRALWQLHLERAARSLSAMRVATPSPRMVEHDRYSLRAGALLLLAGAAFIAGPEKYPRVLAAFDWRTAPEAGQGFRLDAWIDPPPYTGRPPILLTSGLDKDGASKPVQAPAGSNIVVRASASAGVTTEVEGGLQVPKTDEATLQKAAAKTGQAADTEQRYVLRGDGKLRLKQGASTLASFDLVSVPDRPPTISLRGEPKSNTRGALTLGYKVEDDYGIVSAEAQFAKPLISGRAVTGRSLVEAPKMALALPSGAGGLGEGETTGDLSEHPWAGARVTMSLVARDEGGNEGLSDPYELTLPQRTFVKPLARAIVEQRRNLILAPDDRRRVQLAIDTLMFAPEKFDLPSNIYLGLRTISQRLRIAKKDPDLLAVADLMWEMALRLEDGDLSQAERDLRAAQQQLREALDRGATPDELKRLMDQLRAALDKFVQELAEQQMRDQQNADRPQDPNQQTLTITPRDLQALLDRMEEMARNGNTADAQRMLDSLQRMMENLQSARRQNQQNQAQREMNRQLNELDKLTREQQQLRDETFRDRQRQSRRDQQRPQGQRNPNQPGQQGQQGQESDDDDGDQSPEGQAQRQQNLKQRQEALRDRLEQLQKRMKQFGMKGEQGFDEADEAMQEAEQGLGEGGQRGQDKAVDAQGRALEGLRKGAQSMAQQMQQGEPGEGQAGPGPGDPNGPMREGRNQPNPDPLGRESRDRTYNPQSRYDPLGAPAAERAQRVLEELRRRFSDPSRPREELDYLERLLRRY
jgi:uncharacterized protein (TIGR02302 family)